MTSSLPLQVKRDLSKHPNIVQLKDSYIKKAADRLQDIGRKFEYLLNTGNITSRSGLDLTQTTGFTVVAEKLNFFRYISHFRAVHRGAYFNQIRTTAVRKLRPESFGFMCPVHTPDGSPCGLLNHFASKCNVVSQSCSAEEVEELHSMLAMFGVVPVDLNVQMRLPEYVPVHLDGEVLGYQLSERVPRLVHHMREIKAVGLERSRQALTSSIARQPAVPFHLEVLRCAPLALCQHSVHPCLRWLTLCSSCGFVCGTLRRPSGHSGCCSRRRFHQRLIFIVIIA